MLESTMMSDGALTVEGTIGAAGVVLEKEVMAFIADGFVFFVLTLRFVLHFLLLKCCVS